MKDAPTALIMMLTQAEDMIPAHDHLSDSTGNVFVSNGKMYLFQIVKYIYLRWCSPRQRTWSQRMIPALCDSTGLTHESNVTQCIDPLRFVFCILVIWKTRIDAQTIVCVLVLSHSWSNFGVFVILSDIRSMTDDRSKKHFLFLDFCEWWYFWCDSHLGGMW